MKTLLCVLILQYLLACAPAASAGEGVYAFTDADGSVSLSNVPADDRYQTLIVEQSKVVAEPKDIAPAATPAVAPAVAPPVVPATAPAVVRKAQHLAVVLPKTRRLGVAKASYQKIVDDAARSYGLDSALLHAVISVESRYDPKVVSRSGAIGLMQLMPETATRYGVTDSFDAVQNLHGGAKYLRDLLHMFNNNVSLALAAYNAGENAVIRYGNRIPPNRETRKYVPKVLGYYRKYRKEL